MATVEELRAAVRTVLAGEPVVFAYLFGSRASGAAGPGSDVDITVMLCDFVPEEDRLRLVLRRLLEQALRQDVDVQAAISEQCSGGATNRYRGPHEPNHQPARTPQ